MASALFIHEQWKFQFQWKSIFQFQFHFNENLTVLDTLLNDQKIVDTHKNSNFASIWETYTAKKKKLINNNNNDNNTKKQNKSRYFACNAVN